MSSSFSREKYMTKQLRRIVAEMNLSEDEIKYMLLDVLKIACERIFSITSYQFFCRRLYNKSKYWLLFNLLVCLHSSCQSALASRLFY
jgi:hypothetical protein